MALHFRERTNGREVVFGTPWQHEVELALRSARRVGILTSPRRADVGDALEEALGNGIVVALARQHVPQETVDETVRVLRAADVDAIVAYGGGSAIGLGKAVKRELGAVPFVAVPTTFAGSEMTDIYGVRRGSHKDVGVDAGCRPDLVVYDPALVASLPAAVLVPSLFNAMAHAVDALYPPDRDSSIAEPAREAIAELASAARAIGEGDDGAEVRARAFLGAYRAAAILGRAKMGLQHKLAHVVAGALDLSHADTHAALLPHVVAFNGDDVRATTVLQQALGAEDPAAAIFDLAAMAGATMELGRLGMPRSAMIRCAEEIEAAAVANSRPTTAAAMISLLDDARLGRRPGIGRELDSPAPGLLPHAGLRPLLVRGTVEEMAIVLVHGRGSTAESIAATLEPALVSCRERAVVLAPQADDRRWYPAAFSQPIEANQPDLDSALAVIDGMIGRLQARGVPRERIVLAGFSQGACVVLEYLCRNGAGLGGCVAIAGALVGADAPAERHCADLAGMMVITGVARDDRWVSLAEVERTRAHLRSLGAQVVAIDHDHGHTVTAEQHQHIARALAEVGV